MSRIRIDTLMLWVLAGALALLAGTVFAGAREIRGFTLTVSDLDRSVAFYEQALGFTKVSERGFSERGHDELTGVFGTRVRAARLQLGEEFIELEQYLAPAGQPVAGDSRSNDLWFQHFAVVVSDMDRAWTHVGRFPVRAISSAPQTIPESNRAAAGIKAVKFRDPDGHPLELLWFPAGKGNPRWQRHDGPLFLGIDHSAIAVSDTDRSTRFWQDLVGLKVAGGSLNTGPTQEQLDNAFGAVVRITGLRPEREASPGLEFLQYLTPSGGRSAPIARANDLVATRTVVEVDDVDALADKLQASSVSFISPRPVSVPGASWSKGLMVRDPDGHAVLLVQP
jgi:catechol 2,3-dioxygenase-like lactoylglutathione lyase family enzyme